MPKIIKYQKQGKTAYKFQIYTGINPKTGKRSMTTRSGFRTKSAAKTEMKRIEAQVANDTFFDDTSTWGNQSVKKISNATIQSVDIQFL